MVRMILVPCVAALAVGAPSAGRGGFGPNVTNPWFPLKPGTVYVYRGVKDGRPTRDVVTVLRRTAVVDGAPCVLVSDKLFSHGHVVERTTDFYSQDARGNVWYFGEDTAELDATGRVTSTEGTWRSGRNGARAGISMPRHPHVGQSAEQEHYAGHAEDRFRVLSLRTPVRTPYVSSRRALLTAEWTPLEPGVLDHKLYVRGIGTVLEVTVKGGDERNELVSVKRP